MPRDGRMFVPELSSQAIRKVHRTILFGDDRSVANIILTPIGRIFEAILPEATLNGAGWWRYKVFGETGVVQVPQGTAAIDGLCALDPHVKTLFVGLAGALRTFAVGDIVEPSVALLDADAYDRPSSRPLVFPAATVATVSCFNQSLQQRDELRPLADCVDMETAWLFATALRQGRDLRALMVISDDAFAGPIPTKPLQDLESAFLIVAGEIDRSPGTPGDAQPSANGTGILL